MPRRLTTLLSAAAVAGALALSACGEEAPSTPAPSSLSAIHVTGAESKEPTVKVDSPLKLPRTESEVVKEGTGPAISKDELVSLQAVLVNGTDGKTLTSTWKQGPVGLDLSAQSLFPSFKSQLPGKKIGSRVVIASTPADAYGDQGNEQLGVGKNDPVVFVVDLVKATKVLDSAQGKAVAPKKGLPTVKMNAGKPATITVPKGEKAPKSTVVQPLIQGEGATVKKGQTVRVTYTGALLRNGKVFDSSASHPDQPYFEFPVGQGQVIKGWDESIVGQKVGTRLLLVIPPKDGYGSAGQGDTIKGTDTLVFVVDILAAY